MTHLNPYPDPLTPTRHSLWTRAFAHALDRMAPVEASCEADRALALHDAQWGNDEGWNASMAPAGRALPAASVEAPLGLGPTSPVNADWHPRSWFIPVSDEEARQQSPWLFATPEEQAEQSRIFKAALAAAESEHGVPFRIFRISDKEARRRTPWLFAATPEERAALAVSFRADMDRARDAFPEGFV